MILRDVLRQVVTMLEIGDEVDINAKTPTGDTIDKLILVANNVIRELASCYLPLMANEHIHVEDNRYDLTKLSHKAIKVVSVKDGSVSIKFRMYPTYMYVQNGDYDVEYSYLPPKIGLDEEVVTDIRVNEDILSTGIMSEFLIMRGNVDVAKYYDEKFRENLKNLAISAREVRIKRRAYI